MVVTKVTEVGFGDRIKQSLAGFVAGPLLILAAFPVLFSNESCAVTSYKSIAEAAGAVVSVAADKVDAGNDGKLVHLSGKALTQETLKDPEFGVSAVAVKLSRDVEMYQWRQNEKTKTEKKAGGKEVKTTTYTYEETWSSTELDSSGYEEAKYKSTNPKMTRQSQTFTASDVSLGAFRLSSELIDQISGQKPMSLSDKALASLSAADRAVAKISGDAIYLGTGGGTPTAPKIGDYRIKFTTIAAGEVSVMAQQKGNSFTPYQTKAGDPINWLQDGAVSAAGMAKSAESGVAMRTWILRLVGFLMFLIGFNLLFKPLATLGDVIPFIGSIIGAGGFVVALLLSATLSFFTIAIAWIAARPLVGVPMLLLGIGGLVLLIMRRKKPAAAPA